MHTSEYLSPDFLEHTFVRCFMPIHKTQWILGCSRVDVRANFAMPATRLQKFYTLIIVVIVSAACIELLTNYYAAYYKLNRTLFVTCALVVFLNSFTYLSKLFHIRFVRVNDSISLYLLLQKIDRILNLNNNERVYKQQLYLNWAAIGLSFLNIQGGILQIYMDDVSGYWPPVTLALMQFASYLDVMFIGSLVHYLNQRLRFLNKALQELENDYIPKLVLVNPWFTKDLTDKSVPSSEEIMKKLVVTLKLILGAFRIINKIYNLEIFVLAVCSFCWPVLIMEGLIMGFGAKLFSWLACLAIVMWSIFFYMQIVILSVICDGFAKSVKKTKSICIAILCSEGPLMQSAKEMLTIIEYKAPKFSVYGIFTVERHLPFSLISLVVSYIIIFVQFTIL